MSKDSQKTEKKVYEKPEVVHRQILESVANVCDQGIGGKEDPNVCSVLNS